MIIRGVEMDGAQLAQLGTDAGPEYSYRARVVGRLCPSCDLGLPVSCECPPHSIILPEVINLDTRGLL